MLNIKVLGSGCASCQNLELATHAAINKLNLEVEFEKVTDFEEMMEYDITATPALVVNNSVVVMGEVPSKETLLNILENQI